MGEIILALAGVAAVFAYLVHDAMNKNMSPSGRPAQSLVVPIADATRALPETTRGERIPMSDFPSPMRRGTYVTSRGTLGRDVSGVVIVEARWGAGRWYRLATAPARNGAYRVRYMLDKPGLVHLRIALPDGTYLVAKTRIT